jgi:hypothetical protein
VMGIATAKAAKLRRVHYPDGSRVRELCRDRSRTALVDGRFVLEEWHGFTPQVVALAEMEISVAERGHDGLCDSGRRSEHRTGRPWTAIGGHGRLWRWCGSGGQRPAIELTRK